jgi:hypothetical protein
LRCSTARLRVYVLDWKALGPLGLSLLADYVDGAIQRRQLVADATPNVCPR